MLPPSIFQLSNTCPFFYLELFYKKISELPLEEQTIILRIAKGIKFSKETRNNNKVNIFRGEEGNAVEKEHNDLMKSIRKEVEALNQVGITQGNFSLGSYIDNQNQERPCYSMNKAGALQMLNNNLFLGNISNSLSICQLKE